MSVPIFTSTIRQLFSQPVRMGAMIGAAILPWLQAMVDPDPRLASSMGSMWIAVIASAGIIGLEISTGSLSLFFTRPLTRARYLASRWMAGASVAAAMMLLGLAGETAVVIARDGDISPAAFVLAFADRAFVTIGIVSVMVCFSSLTTSLGDLVIWSSIQILAAAAQTGGKMASLPWMEDLGAILRRIASPMLDLHRLLASARVPWAEVTGYAATLTLAAAIAIFVMNRKELSYASE